MSRKPTDAQELARYRRQLERIDRSIVRLLNVRLETAQGAIRARWSRSGKVADPAQEKQVLERGERWAVELGVPPELVGTLFRGLLEEGKTRFANGGRPTPAPASKATDPTGNRNHSVAPRLATAVLST